MKKVKLPLYIALALLLVTSPAFSQNTSVVEQYGDGNEATINQTGGDLLQASIFQGDSATTASYNTAEQNQTNGEGNIATILQAAGSSYNTATQNQTNGEGNVATIVQAASSFTNTAEQIQTGGFGNFATIVQVGAYGIAYQEQNEGVAPNYALIEQNGTGIWENYASQYQGLSDPASEGNYAYISQTGEGNSAYQWQDGVGNNSALGLGTPGITQNGSFNFAYQHQYGNNNLAWIQQSGTYNGAVQYQSGDLNNSRLATAGIIQAGDYNYAVQQQIGNDNIAYINQNGLSNEAYQYQTGNFHVANVTQLGTDNYCSQTQSGLVPKVSNVIQTGTGSSITVVQK